jgi:hypothetical protein
MKIYLVSVLLLQAFVIFHVGHFDCRSYSHSPEKYLLTQKSFRCLFSQIFSFVHEFFLMEQNLQFKAEIEERKVVQMEMTDPTPEVVHK